MSHTHGQIIHSHTTFARLSVEGGYTVLGLFVYFSYYSGQIYTRKISSNLECEIEEIECSSKKMIFFFLVGSTYLARLTVVF